MVWQVLKKCYTMEDIVTARQEFSNELGHLVEVASRCPVHISNYALGQVTDIINLINYKNKLLSYERAEK